ncbi:MAG: alpha/beta hydrolase [Planctomycetia bacterium]|nr:alpha/beta hydrolase [Planctomycetia bacterium]
MPHAGTGEVAIPAGRARVRGFLEIPDRAAGLVVFAHGSGSSRHSPRNAFVAGVLRRAGLATLLMDLLTPEEDSHPEARFDISLLGRRLSEVADWTRAESDTRRLPLGCFGASTGAAAALVASAAPGSPVRAIVSRGGRPDLAGDSLPLVRAPTLLIVGSEDTDVLELNREAQARLTCPSKLAVVPGATHLFEEPGTLEEAAKLAASWFARWLATPSTSSR